MSAAFAGTHEVAGPGWLAIIDTHSITIAVSPHGDVLNDAIETLLAESQRRYWIVTWTRENEAGWDIYLLVRGGPSSE